MSDKPTETVSVSESVAPPAVVAAEPAAPLPVVNPSSLPSGFEWWRQTMAYKTGFMSEDESAKYEQDKLIKERYAECLSCEKNKQWVMAYSPTVRFMKDQIEKVGGEISSHNVFCDHCDDFKAGGFHPKYGILVCQNHVKSRSHLEDTLAHEMVHYYDNTKFKVDWMNLKHHACSEIRASTLSGECRMMNELMKGKLARLTRGHQECAKRRAILSVMANPSCKDEAQATQVVNEVWDSCFNDTRPFDTIYR